MLSTVQHDDHLVPHVDGPVQIILSHLLKQSDIQGTGQIVALYPGLVPIPGISLDDLNIHKPGFFQGRLINLR